jgi:hypothetical protein
MVESDKKSDSFFVMSVSHGMWCDVYWARTDRKVLWFKHNV